MLIKTFWPSSHLALLAVLLAVGLEIIFYLQVWEVAMALGLVAVVAIGILLLRLEEKDTFQTIHTILPILATTGLSGFAFFMPTTALLHIYVLAAGLMLFLLLKHGARQAYPIWNWALSFVVYFLNVAFIFGLRFHLYQSILLVLGLILLVTGLMSVQAWHRVTPSISDVIMPTLGLSLALTEVAWVLLFLPVHYLVQGAVVAILYYVVFNLVSLQYTGRLVRKDVVEYLLVGTVTLAAVLFSARWTQ